MTSIDQIIKQSLNPFDNFAAGNFWQENESAPTVESIHQEALTQIKSVLDNITHNHQTRTLILYGDAGVGKTHFMGRLKKKLNDQAFFVYIEPFPQSDYIWRHVLRYTVDSLVQAPEGQADSQLLLWLKNFLSTISTKLKNEQQSLISTIKSFLGGDTYAERDRELFINLLKKTIGTAGVYNANEYFGVLYDLINPDLYDLACEWLKGDDLDEENLKRLRVRQSIDSEDKAKGILGNFSKISANTQPIVLCFDQLDNIARLPDGSIDLQALFNLNSTIYNAKWKGFLIIVSVRTNTWNENSKRVQSSDIERVSEKVHLKRITLEEAEALLASRLYNLHHQADNLPDSIYPFNPKVLVKTFPSRKASPREVLALGKYLFQDYKQWLIKDKKPPKPKWWEDGTPPPPPPPENLLEEFLLFWQKEYKKVQDKLTKISLLSAPELIRMLEESLEALQVPGVKTKLLGGKHAAYSLSYQKADRKDRVGIIWTEDANMNGFFSTMNACQKAIQENLCSPLYLIRKSSVGKPNLKGNQIYRQIFTYTHHQHIKPNLPSVQTLATYHALVNSALAQELVVARKIINLQELQSLTRKTEILHGCTLLQDLGIVPKKPSSDDGNGKKDLRPVKDFLLNLVKTQIYMGIPTLISEASSRFSDIQETDIQHLIDLLCQESRVKIINPKSQLEDQLICLVP